MTESKSQDQAELPAGTRIGFYEVVGRTDETGRVSTCVGSGKFGSLYRVGREGVFYALKLSKLRMAELDDDARQHTEDRFRREVSILLGLSHPNIVRVHAFDFWPTRDGHPFLVMDFVEGERLYQWRRKTVPSLRRICDVFIKTAMALYELHRHGIFHRDIKSDNLVVRPDGEPILLDMGIARSGANHTLTAERAWLGTFIYFSPEQCSYYLSEEFQHGGRFEPTPRSELHCLGYLFYEILTGRAPFPPDEDDFALVNSIINTVPVPPSTVNSRVPGALDAFVMRLLEKDPAKRHASGQEFAEDLDRVVADASDSSWDAPFDVPPPLPRDAPVPPNRRLRSNSGERPSPAKERVSAEPPLATLAAAAPGSPVSAEKVQPPKPEEHFSPHVVVEKPKFISPVTPQPPATAPKQPDTLQGEMAKASIKLTSATRTADRAKARPLIIGAGALVVIGGLLALINQGSKTQKPKNLLAEVQNAERALASDAGIVSPAVRPDPPLNAAAALAPPPPALVPSGPEESLKKPGAARDHTADIAAEFGRPTAASGTKGRHGVSGTKAVVAPPKPRPEQPAWLQVATQSDPTPTPSTTVAAGALAPQHRYGIPTGSHIRARLQTNLDSRTVANGPVEAMLVRPFLVNGKAIFPSRTMLYGNAQASGARFTIRFARVRLPDDTEAQFEGLAYDALERKPGLPGRIVGAPAGQPSNNTGSKVAAAVASTALGAVGGDIVQDSAREAGQVVLRDATNSTTQLASNQALLLDAGQDFEVFVSKAF